MAPTIPADNVAVSADQNKIMRSLRSFSRGCCGGIGGLRPAHLLDLVTDSTAEDGLRLHQSITKLTNKILRGGIPDYSAKLLFSANLTTPRKKYGGIRSIAVGIVFRRLEAEVVVVSSPHQSPSVQQGEPIGPLLFALAGDQISSGVQSELTVWYQDDAMTR